MTSLAGDPPALTLPADPRSAREARDFVGAVLQEWGLAGLLDEARLLTSELVSNAILHAGTNLTLSVTMDDQRKVVRVTVRDGSPVPPRRRHYSPLSTTGRGLAMIDKAAGGFGVTQLPDGKDIWFELRLPEPASPVGEREQP